MNIYTFDIPNKPTHTQKFFDETGWSLYIEEGKLKIAGNCTEEQAQAALDAHNPPAPTEPTIADKLASVGLSLDELKAAILGGN
jgi:hypothetical protein